MKLLTVFFVMLGGLVFTGGASAHASCYEVEVVQLVQGLAEVSSKIVCGGEPSQVVSGDASDHAVSDLGTMACHGLAGALRETPEEFCRDDPAAPVSITPTFVAAALERLPLPPSKLRIQPPNGRTLVNFATNFYTERAEFTRNVRLLGQRIELRITPSQFTWHFDDGESVTTTSPGSPYPDLDVTHDYLDAGGVSPSVDTTYTAEFRVGGGAWQPVPGSVTIPGVSVALEVVEASPILVGYE